MMRRLQALQDQAARLGALARGLSQSVPDHAEGADGTGLVKVVLDRRGLPVRIEIRDGWERRIASRRLAAAVSEAQADAIARGMRDWSKSLADSRWPARRTSSDGTGDAPLPPDGEPREVSELAEEVIASMQSVRERPEAGPTTFDGSDDQGRVTIRLAAEGTLACVIDQHWASGRGGDSITAALATALARARAKLPATGARSAGVDGLIGDVLATLKSFEDR
jgi:hypothetical protein